MSIWANGRIDILSALDRTTGDVSLFPEAKIVCSDALGITLVQAELNWQATKQLLVSEEATVVMRFFSDPLM